MYAIDFFFIAEFFDFFMVQSSVQHFVLFIYLFLCLLAIISHSYFQADIVKRKSKSEISWVKLTVQSYSSTQNAKNKLT